MGSDFFSLIEESTILNSRVFSLIRLQLISNLAAFGDDGVTCRELKAALRVSDGSLFANLKALEDMGYIKKEPVKIEKKSLDSYVITEEGFQEWVRIKAWLKKFLETGGAEE